ncbi:hypothetical protein [Mycobacterium sp. ST-F2]|uniref:hypothetical protein n=1 Tax=Mycobacterium sp. ST-F2 TaxID=1490484 RepID=UPI000ADC847E|nr:hypothetical protein [Mycobacterium sp. ST-F2]
MATHLRMAAVTWLVAAPVLGAGAANAVPSDLPLSPGVSDGTGGNSSGTSRPGLSSLGDLHKTFGGLTTAATTAGTGALTGFGATPSAGQQLTPRFGDGRNGSNISSANSSSGASTSQPTGVLAGTQSTAASEPTNVAETPTPAPSVQPIAAPLVQAAVVTAQAAVVVADVPLAPVTALSGPLPPAVSEPIQSVAALPGFAVAQALPLVHGLTSEAAALSAVTLMPASGTPQSVSFDRSLGARGEAPASLGSQPISRFAGITGAAGELPQGGPRPADLTFAADNTIAAAPAYRAGYSDDLRAAGLGEVAAVAVPGFTGLLVLTGAGGLIGFRQARAGRAMHGGTLTRFASR